MSVAVGAGLVCLVPKTNVSLLQATQRVWRGTPVSSGFRSTMASTNNQVAVGGHGRRGPEGNGTAPAGNR